jgi:uncharacterized membrane protein (UPF0127 family)
MKIINKTKASIVASKAGKADMFLTRMVGLLDRSVLLEGEALIITKCQSIHMFFMKFAIDAIFVNKSDRVVGLVRNIKPFCLSRVFLKASYVIELPVGLIDRSKTSIGDEIEVSE